eukprot:TRINITY_DN32141_c0_g1_i1.p1 TRINITY_DN32141_c0_g1~~TRINITY_DN32141_c0_g1_i1.p1  ORF type:complete len:204 (-),score=5.44 TRINITY_DN32141_c0_g1_i1:35-646(-)
MCQPGLIIWVHETRFFKKSNFWLLFREFPKILLCNIVGNCQLQKYYQTGAHKYRILFLFQAPSLLLVRQQLRAFSAKLQLCYWAEMVLIVDYFAKSKLSKQHISCQFLQHSIYLMIQRQRWGWWCNLVGLLSTRSFDNLCIPRWFLGEYITKTDFCSSFWGKMETKIKRLAGHGMSQYWCLKKLVLVNCVMWVFLDGTNFEWS